MNQSASCDSTREGQPSGVQPSGVHPQFVPLQVSKEPRIHCPSMPSICSFAGCQVLLPSALVWSLWPKQFRATGGGHGGSLRIAEIPTELSRAEDILLCQLTFGVGVFLAQCIR